VEGRGEKDNGKHDQEFFRQFAQAAAPSAPLFARGGTTDDPWHLYLLS